MSFNEEEFEMFAKIVNILVDKNNTKNIKFVSGL